VRHWSQFAGLGLILAVALVACSGPGSVAPQGINIGNVARDFTLESLDGGQVSLSDYGGSVVLVNFWATWCPPCRAEIPDLDSAYRAHKDEGFVVLGVDVEESRQQVESFMADVDVTYPMLLDGKGQVMKAYRVRGLPMSVIVDRDGVVQVRHMGYLSADTLDDYLGQVLP
jgi:cytochrome c biogenesis protein CcmG/thiol:disulfide interchange protein DsbE